MRASENGDMPARNIATSCLVALVSVTLLTAGNETAAADSGKKGTRERELARRVQLLQQENGELRGKLKELGDKSEELTRAVERAKRDAARASRELARSKKESAEVAAAHTAEFSAKAGAFEAQLQDLKRRLEVASTRLVQRDNEKRQLEGVTGVQVQTMGRQGMLIESCRNDNAKLHQYATELLQKFRNEGRRSADPLIGLGDLESFNVYQEYRDKLDKLRVEPPRLAR